MKRMNITGQGRHQGTSRAPDPGVPYGGKSVFTSCREAVGEYPVRSQDQRPGNYPELFSYTVTDDPPEFFVVTGVLS
jgi:hypothetical protein